MTNAPRYNLRSARGRNFESHIGGNDFQFFATEPSKHGVERMKNEIRRKLFDVCYTQMQAKTGIKKHG